MPKQFRAANIRTVRGLFSPPGERQFFVYDAGYGIAADRLKGCPPPSANSLAKANDSWSSANSDDPSLNRRGRTKGNPLHPVGRKTTEPTANGCDGAESEARV